MRTHFIHTVMRIEMDRKREQITQMCAPRTTSCDYPQSSCESDVTTQKEADTEEGCHRDSQTQEDMDACGSELRSPDRKSSEMSSYWSCTDRDSGNETTETNSQSNSPNVSPKPGKSCLKRRKTGDKKNGHSVTQFNSNERGSCRDCGNTDVTEMLMAGAHFVESTTPIEMEPIIPSQTKVIDCTTTPSSEEVAADSVDGSSQRNSSDNSQQQQQQQQHFQQV